MKECINKNMNVTRKELLAASDVTIVTKRKMAIYAYANLISFLVELGTLIFLSYTGKLNAISILFIGNKDEDDEDAKPTIPLKV